MKCFMRLELHGKLVLVTKEYLSLEIVFYLSQYSWIHLLTGGSIRSSAIDANTNCRYAFSAVVAIAIALRRCLTGGSRNLFICSNRYRKPSVKIHQKNKLNVKILNHRLCNKCPSHSLKRLDMHLLVNTDILGFAGLDKLDPSTEGNIRQAEYTRNLEGIRFHVRISGLLYLH